MKFLNSIIAKEDMYMDEGDRKCITKGKKYDVVSVNDFRFTIMDDDRDEHEFTFTWRELEHYFKLVYENEITNANKVRKFIIKKAYDFDDVECYGDVKEITLSEDGSDILCGNNLLNNIDEQIKGFFKALDFFKVKYEVEIKKVNEKFN